MGYCIIDEVSSLYFCSLMRWQKGNNMNRWVEFGIDHYRNNIRGGEHGSSEAFGRHPSEVARYIVANGFGVMAQNFTETRTCEEIGRILYAFDLFRFGEIFYYLNAKHFNNQGGLTFFTGSLGERMLFAMVIRSRAFTEENVVVVGFSGTRQSYGCDYYNLTGFGVSYQPRWNVVNQDVTYALAAAAEIAGSGAQLASVERSENLLLKRIPDIKNGRILEAIEGAILYQGRQQASSPQASSAPSSTPTEAEKVPRNRRYPGEGLGNPPYDPRPRIPGGGIYEPGPINPSTGRPFPKAPLGPGGVPFRPNGPPGGR